MEVQQGHLPSISRRTSWRTRRTPLTPQGASSCAPPCRFAQRRHRQSCAPWAFHPHAFHAAFFLLLLAVLYAAVAAVSGDAVRPGVAADAAVGTDGVGTAAVTVGVVGGADEADFAAVKGSAAETRNKKIAGYFLCP